MPTPVPEPLAGSRLARRSAGFHALLDLPQSYANAAAQYCSIGEDPCATRSQRWWWPLRGSRRQLPKRITGSPTTLRPRPTEVATGSQKYDNSYSATKTVAQLTPQPMVPIRFVNHEQP